MKLRSFLSDYFNWYQLKLDLYEFKMLIIITSKKITKKIYRKGNQGGIKMVTTKTMNQTQQKAVWKEFRYKRQ